MPRNTYVQTTRADWVMTDTDFAFVGFFVVTYPYCCGFLYFSPFGQWNNKTFIDYILEMSINWISEMSENKQIILKNDSVKSPFGLIILDYSVSGTLLTFFSKSVAGYVIYCLVPPQIISTTQLAVGHFHYWASSYSVWWWCDDSYQVSIGRC